MDGNVAEPPTLTFFKVIKILETGASDDASDAEYTGSVNKKTNPVSTDRQIHKVNDKRVIPVNSNK